MTGKRPKGEFLSEQGSQELDAALNDGFIMYSRGLEAFGLSVDISDHIEEPFYGARVKIGPGPFRGEKQKRIKFEYLDDNEYEDLRTPDDLADAYESEEAPTWLYSNPFEFDLVKIKEFFSTRVEKTRTAYLVEYREFLDDMIRNTSDTSVSDFPDLYDIEIGLEPYSKAWFEVKIIAEIESLSFWASREDAISRRLHQKGMGVIGRMVEHYRWRFSYGVDAMRRVKSVESGDKGAAATAALSKERTQPRLEEMKRLVPKLGVAGAASHLAAKGMGSFAANKKLWERREKK